MDVDDSGASQWSQQPFGEGRKLLDLVFIQDCTGSQGSYISSATKNIEEIYSAIFSSGRLTHQEDLRIGLIAFRDHPPQDHTYITKNFGFSSDPSRVKEHLKGLYAAGGGDGPEAVTAALGEALEMEWRPTASKMVVLIADAPPHGIGEYGDGFSDGSPDGRDPLVIARSMAQKGITLFFVACEPALSGYQYATDFYQAITGITSGLMLPLTTANLLAHAIIGSVLENLDMERLIKEVGDAVAQRILGNNESVDDVARELHEKLLLRNESTKKVVMENIYRDSDEARHNVRVWTESPTLAEARPLLKKVRGPRFTDKYLSVGSRNLRSAASHWSPTLPSRTSIAASASAKVTPPTSPTLLPTSPGSPSSRRVVADFKPFGAPSTGLSVFGTPVAGAGAVGAFGPRPSAFGVNAMRTGGMDSRFGGTSMADDDDDDDGRQRIELREDSITFDQARRIAMQSAWRGSGS